jgi:hypothetical protein
METGLASQHVTLPSSERNAHRERDNVAQNDNLVKGTGQKKKDQKEALLRVFS